KGDVISGDIFISVDTAKKQAKENGHSLETELAVLFVHGLLHLFGFDHKTGREEAEMERWARKVLAN
ncbi:MAG: rRNA maturation RNase YbeY, partial [Patescibacteria group bacterium]